MKKILIAAMVICSSFAAWAEDPNEKVLEAFNNTFPEAENVSWSETPTTFEANFKLHEFSSRITYDKEGNFLKSYRSYYADQLPVMVLARVKERYPEMKIFGVTEVATIEDGTLYYITLEDDKLWREIKADSFGSVMHLKKFKKS